MLVKAPFKTDGANKKAVGVCVGAFFRKIDTISLVFKSVDHIGCNHASRLQALLPMCSRLTQPRPNARERPARFSQAARVQEVKRGKPKGPSAGICPAASSYGRGIMTMFRHAKAAIGPKPAAL